MKVLSSSGKILSINPILKNNNFNEAIKNHHYIVFNCIKCGQLAKKQKRRFEQPYKEDFLCKKCKIKKKFLQAYGVENPNQLEEIKQRKRELSKKNNNIKIMRKICLKKYGNEYYNNRKKAKQTCLEKYGVTSPAKNEEIKEKAKQTCLEKYGVSSFSSTEIAKTNKRKKLLEKHFIKLKHFIIPLFEVKNYEGTKNKKYKWKCIECGNVFEDRIDNGHYPRCKVCLPHKTGTSKYENEIFDFLINNNIKVEKNKRFFEGGKYIFELDIFLKEYSIGVELDGLYWHSEKNILSYRKIEAKKYNKKKYDYFREKNIDVVYIFEDEWREKKEIVKSLILNKVRKTKRKIFARNCSIKEIDTKAKNVFLENNHIQGGDRSSVNIGLLKESEIVSIMTFSKPRFNKSFEWEISRFCSEKDTNIVGGASRLFKYFIKKYNPKSIISYSDIRLFGGHLYKKLDMELSHKSEPSYFYTDYVNRHNRIGFQKHKLKNKISLFNENLSEFENMLNNGYDRIFDLGHNVYIKLF